MEPEDSVQGYNTSPERPKALSLVPGTGRREKEHKGREGEEGKGGEG